MRRYIIIFIIGLVFVSGCSNPKNEKENNTVAVFNEQSKNVVDNEDNNISITPENNEEDSIEGAEQDKTNKFEIKNAEINLVKEGQVNGLEFGIYSSTDEIIENWGMPDRHGYFMGGYYLSYDDKNIFFNTNGYYEDGEIINGEVLLIGISKINREIYGVVLGMSFNEIRTVLGESSSIVSPSENAESELFGDNWTLSYTVGNNTVVFVAEEENGPTKVVYLIKIK